jgi:hypothetical protein
MSPPHFLVFVGASPSLSTELTVIRNAFTETAVIAPAVPKGERGLTNIAVQRATQALIGALRAGENYREPARLSVWSYEPEHADQFGWLWNVFGKSAWIELIPADLKDKDRLTRLYIQERMSPLMQLIHVIAHDVYNGRKKSPVTLPFRNFRNKILLELREYWYRGADVVSLKRTLEKMGQRFRQFRDAEGAHRDDRALLFKGARDTECHGQPHPVGDDDICFVEGRFRFGAALFPGFHYDVRPKVGLLECILRDCRDIERDLKPERRAYINIFPNDHLLPSRG